MKYIKLQLWKIVESHTVFNYFNSYLVCISYFLNTICNLNFPLILEGDQCPSNTVVTNGLFTFISSFCNNIIRSIYVFLFAFFFLHLVLSTHCIKTFKCVYLSCFSLQMHVNALVKRGSLYMQQEKVDSSLRDFDRAAVLDPTNSDVFHHRGQVLLLWLLTNHKCIYWHQFCTGKKILSLSCTIQSTVHCLVIQSIKSNHDKTTKHPKQSTQDSSVFLATKDIQQL